jgi:hypothetical protein
MVSGSPPGTPASSTTKTGRHDIAENGVKHKKNKKTNWTRFFGLEQQSD